MGHNSANLHPLSKPTLGGFEGQKPFGIPKKIPENPKAIALKWWGPSRVGITKFSHISLKEGL